MKPEQTQNLARFALEVLETFWQDTPQGTSGDTIHDLDDAAGDIQEIARKCGLLKRIRRTKPCSEYCACAEWGDPPFECYQIQGWLREAVK